MHDWLKLAFKVKGVFVKAYKFDFLALFRPIFFYFWFQRYRHQPAAVDKKLGASGSSFCLVGDPLEELLDPLCEPGSIDMIFVKKRRNFWVHDF